MFRWAGLSIFLVALAIIRWRARGTRKQGPVALDISQERFQNVAASAVYKGDSGTPLAKKLGIATGIKVWACAPPIPCRKKVCAVDETWSDLKLVVRRELRTRQSGRTQPQAHRARITR